MRDGLLFDLNAPTCSAEDSPAKTSAWRDAVLAWLEADRACGGNSDALLLSSVPVGFSSKTCLAFCRATADGTWEPSSGRWGTWGMGGPTGCLTLNGSDHPSDASVSSLSDVLETGDIPPEYFLSPTACRGILRRAGRRNRALPPALLRELRLVAASTDQDADERMT